MRTALPITSLLFVVTVGVALASCSRPSSEPAPAASHPAPIASAAPAEARKYLLERVDDAAVVQIYADDFLSLPLRDKTLVWHLYQAAIAGRDIYYDQRFLHGLEMRDVLEAILSHAARTDPTTLAEIRLYTKLFWLS